MNPYHPRSVNKSRFHEMMNSWPLTETLRGGSSSEEEDDFRAARKRLGGGLEERSCMNRSIEITKELWEDPLMI